MVFVFFPSTISEFNLGTLLFIGLHDFYTAVTYYFKYIISVIARSYTIFITCNMFLERQI